MDEARVVGADAARVEQAAHERCDAEDGEEAGRDLDGRDANWLALAGEVGGSPRERAPGLERAVRRCDDIAEVRGRELVHAAPTAAVLGSLAKPDQIVGILERKRAEKYEVS